MTHKTLIGLGLPLLLSLATAADAFTLRTAPFRIGAGKTLECAIKNYGNRNMRLTITAHVYGETTQPFGLGANVRHLTTRRNESTVNSLGYCVFEVTGGNRRDVRAAACAIDGPTTGCQNVVPAD